jgi:hypothetical protein
MFIRTELLYLSSSASHWTGVGWNCTNVVGQRGVVLSVNGGLQRRAAPFCSYRTMSPKVTFHGASAPEAGNTMRSWVHSHYLASGNAAS